jgi:uncharacterized protein YjdB
VRVYIGNVDSDILSAIASDDIAQQVSISWLWSPDDPAVDDIFFEEMAALGQSVFAASGDYGAYDFLVSPLSYPAEDPYVTAVGGTDLVTSGAGGAWVSETAWDQSGGGISPDLFAMPSWQAGIATSTNQASATYRNVPDVAMEADFDNYDCDMGTCEETWGGTSFAAPRWAGYMALANQQGAAEGNPSIGFLNPLLYSIGEGTSYATSFHDITSGDNDSDGQTPFYYAEPGYDLVTGWGSPSGSALIGTLAPSLSTGFRLSASTTSLIVNPGSSAPTTITINPIGGFSSPVTLTIPTLPAGVTASFSVNPATTSSVLTVSVDATAERGSFLLPISGSGGGQSATAYVAVEADAPGFAISPTNPMYQYVWIAPGYASSTILDITDFAGFTGTPTLAISSPLPAGVTAVFNPSQLSSSTNLTFIPDTSAPNSQTALTVSGSSGTQSATQTVYLAVTSPQFRMDFSPEETYLAQGGSFTMTVSAIPVGNYAGGAISLSSLTLPSGVTAKYNPTSIEPGQTSTLTVTASASATLGGFYLGVVGSAGDLGTYTAYMVTVTATPQAWFSVTPEYTNFSLAQGGTLTNSFTVTDEYGFNEAAQIEPPSAPGLSLGYQETDSETGSGKATYTASNTAMPTLWSSSGYAFVPSEPVGSPQAPIFDWILVTPTVPFTLSTSTSAYTLTPGTGVPVPVSIVPQNGFSGSAELSATGLPAGFSSSFDSNPSSGDTTLTINADDSVPAGTYYVNIAAAGGGETLTRTVTLTVNTTGTSTSLSITPSGGTLTVGSSYKLTATVTPSSGSTVPTGNVIFTIGSATHTVALNSSGVATYTGTAPTASGGLSISAAYQGSTEFAVSTSNTLNESIVAISTSTVLSIAPNSSSLTAGSGYTLTATVTPSSGSTVPSGNVIFTIGTAMHTVALNSSGVATYAGTAPTASGSLSISAAYQGSTEFAVSTSNTLNESIVAIGTSTVLSIAPNGGSLTAGSGYSLTATVTPASGSTVPTGNVIFTIGSATQTVALNSSGVASYAGTAPTATGGLSISAAYQGSTEFAVSTSNTLNESIVAIGTSTVLSIAPNGGSLTVGSGYTLTATVTPSSGSTVPTGNVIFTIGSATQTVALNSSGVATYAGTAPTATGSLSFSAAYQGSTEFAVSTSNTLNESIVAIGTTTALTASPNPVMLGSQVTLTATVTPASGTTSPTGTVSFYNGTSLISAASVASGSASLMTSTLPAGSDSITATYGGSATFGSSTSNAVSLAVNAPNPTPAITTLSPAFIGAGSADLTITVNGSGFTSGSTVYWGTSALSTQFLGATQLTAKVLAADIASPGITAITVETPTPGGGTSNALKFEVDSGGSGTGPTFTTVTVTVAPGSPATYPVTLSSSATDVNVQCLNLPNGATCSYSPTTGALTISTLSSSPAGTYLITVIFTETMPGAASGLIFLPFLLLPLVAIRRRWAKQQIVLMAFLALAITVAATTAGCGGGGGSGGGSSYTPPQTHTVTSSGTVTLVVQ